MLIWFTCSAIIRLPTSDNVAVSEILEGNVCLITVLHRGGFRSKSVKINEKSQNIMHNVVQCIAVLFIGKLL